MSDTGKFKDEHLSRGFATKADDSPMRCYLGMEGRVTVRQVIEHFAETYPNVDPMDVELNYATAVWEEPATDEDRAKREAWAAKQAERTERWERETFARLQAKYGAPQ